MSADACERFAAAATNRSAVILEGFHAVKHAVRFGADVQLIVTSDHDAAIDLAGRLAPDLVDIFQDRAESIDGDAFATLSSRRVPTAVIAVALRPAFGCESALTDAAAPTILLDQPRNHANVGAVVRVAAAVDAAAVLTTGDHDPWHPAALRGSAGLHFALPVGTAALSDIPARVPVIGVDADGDPFNPQSVDPGCVLAFGSERRGLSAEVRERCAALVALPMRRGVSSLNLATAVSATLMSWRLATGWPGR